MHGFNVPLKKFKGNDFIKVKKCGRLFLMHVKMFYLASIYMIMLNYICMHVLRHYGRLKMCK